MTYIKDSFTILSFKFVLSFAFSSTIFVTFFFSSFNSWENLNKWNKNIKQNIILKISKCKVFKKNGEVYTKLTKLNVHSSYIIQNWQSLYIVFHLYVKRLWQCLYIYNLFTLIWNYNFFMSSCYWFVNIYQRTIFDEDDQHFFCIVLSTIMKDRSYLIPFTLNDDSDLNIYLQLFCKNHLRII